MDPVKILKRAWHILWSYPALWVFGLILALAAGSSSGSGDNGVQYRDEGPSYEAPLPQSMEEGFRKFTEEMNRVFNEGLPEAGLPGVEWTTLLWILGAFVLVMLITGLLVAAARYVSETAVIRMVDEYENTGSKMTVPQGFRMGWSRTSWRLFLINLIVHVPAILLAVFLIIVGVIIFTMIKSGNEPFTAVGIVSLAGLVFLAVSVGVIASIVLLLLRNFFWRVCALEDTGVRESMRRGFALVREDWKNVGLMWIIMIGLGIVWVVAFVIAVIVTIPVVILTAILGALVAGIPALLLTGLFSLFLSGPWPWIVGILFVLPLFFVIAFSPWLLMNGWRQVFISSVWTLTYREIKAPPVLAAPAPAEPAGDQNP